MKPDLSYFPKLTDEGQVASWHFKFKAAAYGANLGDVLDPTYVVPLRRLYPTPTSADGYTMSFSTRC